MTAISKNVYLDVLYDIVNKYNNKFIELLKWNLLTLHMILMLNTMNILIKRILNLKLVTMLEFQNIKTFLLKDTLQIAQKKFLLLVKLKIQFLGLKLLVTWMVKKLQEVFMKKNCKKLVKKNFEKYLKEKVINCMSNGKGMIVLIVELIKKTLNEIF